MERRGEDGIRWWRRAAALVRRSRLDDELAEEIRLHIALRRDQLVRDGMAPRDAEAEARRLFGNTTAIREETHDMWGFPSFDTLVQDLRYGVRMLRRSPLFTVSAVLSLGIGIGAATAVFGLANTVLLRKLPVPHPDELVVVRWVTSGSDFPFESLSGYASQKGGESSSTSFALAAMESVRRDMRDVLDTFGFADLYSVNVAVDGRPETGTAQVVSGNYFSALGVVPAAGRLIADADDRPSAPPVAVISHDYWQRRFGGAPDVVGRAISVNNVTFTIAGVSQAGFAGTLQVGQAPAISLPLSTYAAVTRGEDPLNPNFWWVLMMGRLKPGTTLATVQPRMDAIVKQSVRAAKPDVPGTALPRVLVEPGASGQVEDRAMMREPLRAMAFVVGIVLLVACANVSTLLLARGRSRVREVAVRVAIGAPRRRIVRQLLTESALLAGISGLAGLALARWLTSILAPALVTPGAAGLAIDVGLDWRVLGFALLLALACSVLFGVAPALRSTDVRLPSGLQEAGRGSAAPPRTRTGSALVVVQVALSLLLLSAAGLLAYSVRNLLSARPGFDPQNVLVFDVNPQQNGYDEARSRRTLDDALARLRVVPGVRAASLSSHRLIASSASIGVASRLDEALPDPGSEDAVKFREGHQVWRQAVDDRFLDTMGIPVVRGRSIAPVDTAGAMRVAVVNESLARQLFGTTEVVDRELRLGLRDTGPIRIVGVAADARYTSMRREPPPTVYLSFRQEPVSRVTFEVRAAGDATALAPAIREAMRQVDATLPLVDLRTQDDQILESLTQERLFATLATLLGAITLVLSAVGIFGLLAYSVARRTQEIGVRMALGAERSMVRWMILKQSLVLTLGGVALGIPAALFGTKIVESMLYGLTPRDPMTVASAAIVMALASLAAAWVPARRASRVDPIIALRSE